jgi:DNA-binding NarL/FixJ family response regulator
LTSDGTLCSGRRSFEDRSWRDAYIALRAADQEAALDVEDVERLAMAAHLLGRDRESNDLWTRAHQGHLSRGDPAPAARCAFWLALGLLLAGESAQGRGWVARGQRLLHDGQDGGDSAAASLARGYLLVPVGLGQLHGENDATAALATSGEVLAVGERFDDVELQVHARVLRGRALIRLAQPDEGLALLDEAMVSVTAGEVSAILAGLAYCAMIEACQERFDLDRAGEWTAALGRWCESQPDLVPYRGQCLVHRAEIMRLRGAWPDALHEATRASEHLPQTAGRTWIGGAYYQRGELHRLRGEYEEAERAFREASRWGQSPQPGLAQLRVRQGRAPAAATSLRRALEEAPDRATRLRILPAYVGVMLDTGEVPAAFAGANELSAAANELGAPLLRAQARGAAGAVLLAEGDAERASVTLREALALWLELDAPYEVARTRVLLGRAALALGDEDAAQLELESARQRFEALGARPDLAALATAGRERSLGHRRGGLTPRELEVLRLVAEGKTNREIAAELVLSGHTVRRHLQNTFGKLGVSTRAAAASRALRRGLL